MSIRYLTKKKRKLNKENKKKMEQAMQGPRTMTAEEAINQMTQTLGTVRGQIEQQKSNYANSYITLASKVAEGLMLATKDVDGSISEAFKFTEAFRLKAMEVVPALKDAAPVEDILLKQEAAMVDNLDKIQQLILDNKRKQEEAAVTNVVQFPEVPLHAEESPAV